MLANVWLIPTLPLVAAMLVALLGRRVNKFAGSITAGAVFFSLIIAIKLAWSLAVKPSNIQEISTTWLKLTNNFQLEVGVLLDPLVALMLVIVTLVSLMVQIYSLGYMAEDKDVARYFATLSFFTFAMLCLVMANNLVQMYMFWELVGLSSYLLIGFWYQKKSAADAAKKAFVVTRFGDLGFLIGILVLAYCLDTLNILEINKIVTSKGLSQELATTIALLIFAGAVGKSAQFPLHIWLPDAMEGPTPVSALIHAATMVAAGIFLIARLFTLFVFSETALWVVAYIGAFTAFFAATIACVQSDIKRILAYSTLSQLGYMMLALGCGGYFAGMFHLTTHAFFKALLFLGAGSVIHALHTNDIWKMGGLGKSMKITSFTILVAAMALSGVFPFSGFFSKDEVLLVALKAGRIDLLVIGLITAGITAFYIFRLYFVVFTGKSNFSKKPAESSGVMLIPLLVLAFLSVFLGIIKHPLEVFLLKSFGAPKLGHGYHNKIVPLAAFIVFLLGLFWAYIVYFQRAISASLLARKFSGLYKILQNKYYCDEGYNFLVKNVMLVLSRVLAWFDRKIVDGAVDGIGWLCRMAGEGLRKIQVGRLAAYLLALVLGLIVIVVSILLNNSVILELWPT